MDGVGEPAWGCLGELVDVKLRTALGEVAGADVDDGNLACDAVYAGSAEGSVQADVETPGDLAV